MQRNAVETLLGAFVILVAVAFILFFQETADLNATESYEVKAKFSRIDGLNRGSPVRISGVEVGKVTDFELDPESYTAVVTLQIHNDVELPYDTAAVVSSESLLGGKFLSLEPGADSEMLQPGDMIEFTQSTPGIEALLGQAIYSFSNKKDSGESAPASYSAAPALEEPPVTEVAPAMGEQPAEDDDMTPAGNDE